MIPFQDITVLAALFNFFSMIGNLFWSWRLNSIKGSNELINYWKGECEIKDDKYKELQSQYNHQLVLNKKLEGELIAYKNIHHRIDNATD